MAAKVENLELFQRFGLKPLENQWVIKPSEEKKPRKNEDNRKLNIIPAIGLRR